MPNIWITNIEDVGPSMPKNIGSKTGKRYLWFVDAEDIVISPDKILTQFWDYLIKLRPQLASVKVLIPSSIAGTRSASIIESLTADKKILTDLKEIKEEYTRSGKNLYLLPYLATPALIKLSEMLEIPLHPSVSSKEFILNNYVTAFNSKSYIKDVASQLAIPHLPAVKVSSLSQLVNEIKNIKKKDKYQPLIVKKVLSGGGYGNYSGTAEVLLNTIEKWYQEQCTQGEVVLIEPYLTFNKIVGSLAFIDHNETLEFLATDLQIINNNSWSGVIYPYRLSNTDQNNIREWTLLIAKEVCKLGGRGFLNLDFGISEQQIYLLESNFRYNGLSLIHEIVKIFKTPSFDPYVYYCDSWKPSQRSLQLEQITDNCNQGMVWIDYDPPTLEKKYLLLAQDLNTLDRMKVELQSKTLREHDGR